ncbi:MAG: hypothetical protein VYC63_08075, partial [Verrucomicrobiota bacterium]|nr:hypothetical protein [Verrucomicrobiota bacterium]
ANLAQKRFIVSPTAQQSPIDQHGFFVRTAENKLMKFFHGGNKGATMYFVDMNTGNIQQSLVEEQTENVRDLSPQHIDPNPKFDKILLLRSDLGISAYTSN